MNGSPDERKDTPVGPQLRLLAAFAWTSALNYGFGLVASRVLGPGDFGLLAFAQSILLLGGFVLQSGVPWTLTRDLVPAAPEQRAAIVRGAVISNLAIAGGMAALLALLYVAGPLRTGLEELPILLGVAVALPLISLAAVWRAANQGLSSYGRVGVIQGVEVTGKTLSGLALAAVGFGAIGAVAGFAVGALLAAVVGGLLVVRRVPLGGRSITWPSLRTVGPMFGVLLALALILNLDLLAMKLLGAGREATGHYQAAIILANAPYFLVSSAVVPVLFTRLAGAAGLGATRPRVAEALRFALVLVLPMELVMIAFPDAILGWLFPPAYAVAAPIVRLMAVGNGLLMIVAVLAAAHQGVGRSAEVGRVLLIIAGAEVVALAMLVPRFGAMGAVLAFDSAALAGALILGLRYWVRAEVRLVDVGAWARGWGVALAAGAVVGALVLATGRLPIALAAAGLTYYGVALALRLVPELHLSGRGRGSGRPIRPAPSALAARTRPASRPVHEDL